MEYRHGKLGARLKMIGLHGEYTLEGGNGFRRAV